MATKKIQVETSRQQKEVCFVLHVNALMILMTGGRLMGITINLHLGLQCCGVGSQITG